MISPIRLRCSLFLDQAVNARLETLAALPGVYVNETRRGSRIACLPDAVIPVRNILRSWGMNPRVDVPGDFRAAHAARADFGGTEEDIARATGEDFRPVVDYTGKTLWDWMAGFQREGCVRIRAYGGGHIWQDPGAGKTVQEILGAFLVARRAEAALPSGAGPRPILFITKAAVRYQFGRQIRRFTTHDPYVYHPGAGPLGKYLQACGPRRDAAGALRWDRRPVLVFAWTDLREWWRDLLEIAPIVAVGDETHVAKAAIRETWVTREDGSLKGIPKENLAYCAGQLAKGIPFTIGATATEIENRLDDAWGQLDFVQPGGWGRTARRFITRYVGAVPRIGGGMILGKPSNEEELQARLSVVAFRVPPEISKAGLPPKRRTSIWIPTEEQVREVGGFAGEIRAAEKGHGAEAEDRRVMLRVAMAASRKRRFIVDYLVERLQAGERWLVLDVWRRNLEVLYESIRKAWPDARTRDDGGADGIATGRDGEAILGDPFLRQNVFLVMGGDQAWRNRVQCRWMGEDEIPPLEGPGLVLGTIDALGTGMDWHRSHGLGFAGLPYTPGRLKQSEDRVWRRGLELTMGFAGVEIVFFIAEGTYDERIVEILLSKLDDVAAIGGDGASVQGLATAIEGIEGKEDEIDRAIVSWLATCPSVD